MRLSLMFTVLLWGFLTISGLGFAQDAVSQSNTDASVSEETAADALLKILEDPAERDALIEELKKARAKSEATVDDEGASNEAAPIEQENQPLSTVLAQYTTAMAEDLDGYVHKAAQILSGVTRLLKGEITINTERAIYGGLNVLFLLVCASIVYWFGQKLFRRFQGRMASKYSRSSWFSRGFVLIMLSVVDALTVFLSCILALGLFLVPFVLLERQDYLLDAALDAFWAVGISRVVLRFVFSPFQSALRPLPFSDEYAHFWYRKLFQISIVLGYGLLLAVPYVNIASSFVIGNALRFVLVAGTTLYTIGLIYRSREWVAEGVSGYAERMSNSLARQTVTGIGYLWHWIAMAYVSTLFMLWFTRPFDAIEIAVRSTGFSVLVIMIGFLISLAITKPITNGIRLPDNVKRTLPALEGRLNAFVPTILKFLRFIVFLSTVLVLLDIWSVTNFSIWLMSSQGENFVGRFLSAILVIVVAFAIWLAVMAWIDLRLRARSGYVVTARERTLFQLFRNAFTMVILVMAALLALSEVGINIGPLIAGAGVVGLAISFGAQTLVKDIITGAFIQIENAINEGDVVTVAGVTGVVERLTVRSVRIRDLDGTAHIVPFSSVDMVANFMRDFSYHVAVIGVSYDTDIRKAKAAMVEAFERLKASDTGVNILGDLEMHGVTMFGDSAINIRARIKTLPGEQWGVGRAYNEFVKDVFDETGIEIPFPQVTYHMAGGYDVPVRKKVRPKQDLNEAEPENSAVQDGPADDGPAGDHR